MRPGGGEPEPVYDTVEPPLEQPHEVLAGHAVAAAHGLTDVAAALTLTHAVAALGALLGP